MPRRLFVLKLLLAVAALAALAHMVEWEAIVAAARAAEPGWALAALLLAPLNVGLEAYRWHRLMRRPAPGLRFRTSLAAVLSGYPLGLLTPGRVGDYVGRALYLRDSLPRSIGVPPSTSAALTFGERMATLACCLVGGLAVLPHFLLTRTAVTSLAWTTILALGLFGTAALLLLLTRPHLARVVLAAVLPFRRLRRVLAVLDRFTPRDAAELLGLSALRYGLFSTQFVLLVEAFAPGTDVPVAYAGVALVFFAKSAVPAITLGDLGIRESAAVFFLGAFGVAAAAAFNASLGLFAVNLLLPALVGLPLLPRLRLERAAPAPGVPAPVAPASVVEPVPGA